MSSGSVARRQHKLSVLPKVAPMSQNIAGKRVIACPDCGSSVREDLLRDHAVRCKNRPRAAAPDSRAQANAATLSRSGPRKSNAQSSAAARPLPALSAQQSQNGAVARSRPAQEPASNAERNRFVVCPRCGQRIPERYYAHHPQLCELDARERAAQSAATRERKLPKTADGYTIDSCGSCGRRICLVPDGGFFRVFDIVQKRKSSVPHQCGGSDEDRRTRLVYVDSRAGSVAPPGKKRGPRKL